MTPRTHLRVIWGLVLALVLLVIVTYVVTSLGYRSVRAELRKTRAALDRSEFSCPENAEPRVERWGEIGWSRYCVLNGQEHGPWQAWEKEKVAIVGAFAEGERHGTWKWFNVDGTVHRETTYKHGEELTSREAAPAPH